MKKNNKQKGDLVATLTGKTHLIKVKVLNNNRNYYEVYEPVGDKLGTPTIIYGSEYAFWTYELRGLIHEYSLSVQPELFT